MGGVVNLLAHALTYAERGWPVFPLHQPIAAGCSCGNAECTNIGKHPRTRHGLDDATTDLGVVRAWWSRWPEANIGARTGIAFDVLDVDTADVHDGTAQWPLVDMPGGPVVRTGRGWHFYVLPTGLGNRARFAGPCDWRGVGGYVILPPSLHATGSRYEWHAPATNELRPSPGELLDLVSPPKPAPRPQLASVTQRYDPTPGRWSPAGLVSRLALAAEGTRNEVLNWAAHKVGADARAGKATEADALGALDQLAEVAARIGLADREIEATIRSGYRSGAAVSA